MKGILDLFREAAGHNKPQTATGEFLPVLRDYRVGVVVSNLGLNDRQLAELSYRLDFIARSVGKDGRIHLFVPGFSLANAEESVPRDVRNLLERKKPHAAILYIATKDGHSAGVAHHIYHALIAEHRCDEIWCCPALGQTANSSARVAQVYRMGLAAFHHHTKFKFIPPWVEPPTPPSKKPAVKKPKKGTTSWKRSSSR